MQTAVATHNQGLSSAQAADALKRFGANSIASKERFSIFKDFITRLKNPLLIVLIFAASVSALVRDWTSSIIIILMVLVSVVLDTFNTFKSEKAAEKLKAQVQLLANVVRDGQAHEIPAVSIVPHDIVLLAAGDMVPADGVVLDSKEFFVNESELTGESFPVEKFTDNEVSMGSSAVSGEATVLIKSTGAQTKLSSIARRLAAPDELSEFDVGLKKFSYLIVRITFILVIVVFLINAGFKHNILEAFMFSLALAVGLTPEMLPMIIALNLSKGSLLMAKHGVIVKKLSAIQNFGTMDILCTDKTGTLTEDKIALIKHLDLDGNESDNVFRQAFIVSSMRTGFHNPLDAAIKANTPPPLEEVNKVDEIPFDYPRKRDSVVFSDKGVITLVSKGAFEEIVAVCSSCRFGGQNKIFDKNIHDKAEVMYQQLSSEGFRVLAVAQKVIPEKKEAYTKSDETNMELIGLLAFLDPPKKDVSETLQVMEDKGIEIKIVTGDNELVTKKITDEIGLKVKGILLGSEMSLLSDAALGLRVEAATIIARVNPEQKERIVKVLRERNHVVGYLGDGINDAPPLKAADVSFSVNNAVDVAKEAADMILMHKSLRNLTDGITEGRKTFVNTKKYMMMNLSSNFGNMFSMAAASLFLPFLPMLPIQVLLNNLMYDTSQLALPLDNVDAEDLAKPRRLDLGLIKKFMLFFGPISSFFDFTTFFVLFGIFHLYDAPFQTGWFLESLTTQMLVVYIIRTKKIPFFQSMPSKILGITALAMVAVAFFLTYSRFGNYFKFAPLPWPIIAWIAGITVVYLVVTEAMKRWFFKRYDF